MSSEFSFFSRPHPLLPVAATYFLPTLEGITDVAEECHEIDLTWGHSSIPAELVNLTAPQPNLIELSGCDLDSQDEFGRTSSSVSSLDVCSRAPSLLDALSLQTNFTAVDAAFSAFDRSQYEPEQGQVIGPAGSLKELLGLPFIHEADSLSLTVHRVGRTLLIDHPPAYSQSWPAPASPPMSDEEELGRDGGERDDFGGCSEEGEVGRGLRERRRRRRAAQRTKKKLSAFEKALGRFVSCRCIDSCNAAWSA
jgi:hypothetical protein